MFENQSILITGGAGSFGAAFLHYLHSQYPGISRIVVYSRDEYKHYQAAETLNAEQRKKTQFLLGDVRDANRLREACSNINVVVHAAALKHVPLSEYHPDEYIKTNIGGAENVVRAALDNKVRMVVGLSTSKAVAPANLYGATKLCADKLLLSANNLPGNSDTKFAVARFGNILNTRGSVLPLFMKQKSGGALTLTNEKMTRFSLTLEEAARHIAELAGWARGGEIYVPKCPSYRVGDLASAVCPDCAREFIGLRPGEKLHEEIICEPEAPYVYEYPEHYLILSPPYAEAAEYQKARPGARVSANFRYSSDANPDFLSAERLQQLIQQYYA